MSSISLPSAFTERIRQNLPQEADALLHALNAAPVLSVRVNKKKMFSHFIDEPDVVPWCSDGRYLSQRPDFTADPLLHAGAYYVQEASSMFIQYAVKQILDTTQCLRVLDVCAAPGGKSTLLLDTIHDQSLLVSNEVIRSRASILRENIAKWGRANVLVTNNDPQAFRAINNFFDLVLVDAPCSGEGMFRKDESARKEWSTGHVQLCAARQQRILSDVAGTVKHGGVLVYSTCTFSIEENEQQLQKLLETGKWESVPISVPHNWDIITTRFNGAYGYRFYPHKTKGEGFFLGLLRRKGDTSEPEYKQSRLAEVATLTLKEMHMLNQWIIPSHDMQVLLIKELLVAWPRIWLQDYQKLKQQLNIIQCGITLGKRLRDELIPAHEFALSMLVNDQVKRVELNREQAITFLKKGNLVPEVNWPKGWVLICFNHFPLGWAKVLDKRINNYYPTEWRILKDIEF